MASDPIQDRFIDEIKLRGFDDMYIDKNEEREILQIAIHQGIGLDSARSSLAKVSAELGYVLESEIINVIKERCEAASANEGRIDQKKFQEIFEAATQAAKGRRKDNELKKIIITVMEDHGFNKVQTGWLFNWYRAMKREVGMR